MGKVRWKVGTYTNQRFTPEKEGVVDWGAYYAAKTMHDRDGNCILWGWITETRPDAEMIAAGWAGAMSLPRILALNSENELEMKVAPAAQQLRGAHLSAGVAPAALQQFLRNLRIRDLAAEFELEFRPRSSNIVLHLQSESGENFVSISCMNKAAKSELRVDSAVAELNGAPGSPVHLHMFLDGSVLEIFANGTTALTKRIYKTPSGPLTLKLEGDADITSLDVWQMTPISKDRLTGSMCS
jgi:beta-fructofuranosidase